MSFRIGKRIVEVRGTFVASVYMIVLLLMVLFGIFADLPQGFRITYFTILIAIIVFSAIVYFISRSGVDQRMRPTFDMEYKLMEFLLTVRKNMKNIALVSFIFLLMFSAVFYVASYGLPTVTMPKINVRSILPEKSPSIETPKNDIQSTIKETPTTEKTTTTTTTTTTTRKRPSPEGRKSGFYVYQKDVVYTDCTFDGKGHDAVLMPSGNYYCRSNEQRMEITVGGVEKICCITP